MSGGYFNYAGNQIQLDLDSIANDASVKANWPLTAALLSNLGQVLALVEYDMDLHLSGDTKIYDNASWDKAALGLVLEAVMKAAPDEWFPRGKWATIQAIQGRREGK